MNNKIRKKTFWMLKNKETGKLKRISEKQLLEILKGNKMPGLIYRVTGDIEDMTIIYS